MEKITLRRWLDRNKMKMGRSPFGIRVVFSGEKKPLSKFFPDIPSREDWVEKFVQSHQAGDLHVTATEGKLQTRERTLSWAIEQYHAHGRKVGWRPHTRRAREMRLDKLLKHLGDVALNSIERADVIGFIETANTNQTRKGLCSDAATFLSWCGCEDQGRDWLPVNKFYKMKWTKLSEDEKTVEIMNVEDTRDLMGEILPKYQAGHALASFAGIRPMGELDRLDWSAIDFSRKRIIITGDISKTRRRRILTELPENLWKWLEVVPEEDRKGNIIHSYAGYQQARQRAAKRLGIKYPADGARHSFASYGYWRGEEWCRRTMGHTATTDVFHKHYVDAGPSQAEAKEYFDISPAV